MKTNKINALEAVIAALEISESELAKWFNNRSKSPAGLIPTELPLVYRRGNELTVENGLNLSRKSELWGIQLLSGKPGILPSKDVLKKHWGNKEEAKFAATVEVLEENEIGADGYRGCIWCSEECNPHHAYYFDLTYGGNDWYSKDPTNYGDRVALAF